MEYQAPKTMIVAHKWDFMKHKYDPVLLPNTCKTYADDLDEIVTCPSCGKKLPMGETYTSRRFHTPVTAFGYGVCHECYEQEWDEEYAAMKSRVENAEA